MCESVYENAHAERINGTIKNDYLIYYAPEDYNQLITLTDKAVIMYSYSRPHSSLRNSSPAAYELSTKSALLTKKKEAKKKSYNNNNKFDSSLKKSTYSSMVTAASVNYQP